MFDTIVKLFQQFTYLPQFVIIAHMTNNFISSAYACLTSVERAAVDSYVQAVRIHAERHCELIKHALSRPIPADVVARSRGQLEKPLVKAAINEQIGELARQQDLAAERILQEHMLLAMSNMADYLTFTEHTAQDGSIYKTTEVDLSKCTREQLASVKKYKVTRGIFGTQISIELHDKGRHMDALGKMMALDQADNPVYLRHIATPKDVKPLANTATPKDAEKAYIALLESIK